jgi:hypothetical protein
MKDIIHTGCWEELHKTLKNPKVEFCDLLYIDEFIAARQGQDPYYLIAQGVDFGIEHIDEYTLSVQNYNYAPAKTFQLQPNIIKIYATNCANHHIRFAPLPLGIHKDEYGYYKGIEKFKTSSKSMLCYANFGLGSLYARKNIWGLCKASKFTVTGEYPVGVPIEECQSHFDAYYKNLGAAKYSICPPGLGHDSYRIWESVMMNTIPIVQNTEFGKRWERYGFVLTDDWKPSQKMLEDTYEIRITKLQALRAQTKLSYWHKYFENLA